MICWNLLTSIQHKHLLLVQHFSQECGPHTDRKKKYFFVGGNARKKNNKIYCLRKTILWIVLTSDKKYKNKINFRMCTSAVKNENIALDIYFALSHNRVKIGYYRDICVWVDGLNPIYINILFVNSEKWKLNEQKKKYFFILFLWTQMDVWENVPI